MRKTTEDTVLAPEILNIPLLSVKKPVISALNPLTVKLLRFISSTGLDVVTVPLPFVMVRFRKSVTAPVPLNVLFVAPVKVILPPAVLPLVLKSKVPLLVRLPANDRACVVAVPLAAV